MNGAPLFGPEDMPPVPKRGNLRPVEFLFAQGWPQAFVPHPHHVKDARVWTHDSCPDPMTYSLALDLAGYRRFPIGLVTGECLRRGGPSS